MWLQVGELNYTLPSNPLLGFNRVIVWVAIWRNLVLGNILAFGLETTNQTTINRQLFQAPPISADSGLLS
jgi:hypothetical protein